MQNERAIKLFENSRKLKDCALFRRTCNINKVEDFVALKLKYHNSCLLKFEPLFQSINKPNSRKSNLDKSVEQNDASFDIIRSIIEPQIIAGKMFSLNDVLEMIEKSMV